jgi:limonene-1,2-epoxide hydrolase
MSDLEARLRAAFQVANERQGAGLDDFFRLYHDDVYFEDPMQRAHGKEAFTRAMRRMYRNLRDVEIQFQTFSGSDTQAHATWTMRFRPKLGPTIVVEGASLFQLRDGLILVHRDYWDLLSSLMETSPLTALVYRAITRRLA